MPENELKRIIEKDVFMPRGRVHFVSPGGETPRWIFDFRASFMQPKVLRLISAVFWERFKGVTPFQIGGVEVAAIPLVTGVAMALSEEGHEVNAFFIRKSRKKYGLLEMIEGKVTNDKIILLDDLINTGKSFIRQVEIAEALGKKVHAVFTLLRFREESYYSYFHERGIQVISIFTLDDFKESLGTSLFRYQEENKDAETPMPFASSWYFKSEGADFFQVRPKSTPVLDDTRVYLGTDSGIVWALDQKNGNVAWQRKIGFALSAPHVFSTPALHDGTLYLGAHDGNFYALDARDGSTKWLFGEADWIHSSPCIAEEEGLVVVGLEYGWWRKTGAIVGIDLESGKERWSHKVEGYASSPTYVRESRSIICGASDGEVHTLDAKTGASKWKFKADGSVMGRPAVDLERAYVVVGSFGSKVYILALHDGTLLHEVPLEGGVWSDPLIYKGRSYVTSLDKHLYCIDLSSGKIVWKYYARARIFSSPLIAEDKIYFGSNDARWYEVDPDTGKETAFFQAVERITSRGAYNPATQQFFVPTFANELYCLKKVA
jgi:orotate phosphoribosyltransferase